MTMMGGIVSDNIVDTGVSMSDRKRGLAHIHQDASIAIPVLQTVSLRRVLEFFGDDIVELEAKGGNTADVKTETLNEFYGVNFTTTLGEIIKINYKQVRKLSGEPENPLDRNGIKILLDLVEEKLPSIKFEGNEMPPDICTQKIVIEVIDDDLAKTAAEVTPWFDGDRNRFLITGVNDPAEDRKGSQARRPLDEVLSKNRGLMVVQGFKGRVINFRRVIETARIYGKEDELYLAQWDGPEDHFPKFPRTIGEHIYDNILPDTYSELNYYYPDAQSIIQLDGWVSR